MKHNVRLIAKNRLRTQNTNDLCVAKPVATDRHADPKKNISLGTIELEGGVEGPSLFRQEQALSTEKNSHFLWDTSVVGILLSDSFCI